MLPDINDKETVLEYLQGLQSLAYSFYINTNLKSTIKEFPLIISGNDDLIELIERDISIVKQAIQDQNPKIRYLNIYNIAPNNIPFGIEDNSIYERILNESFEKANTLNIRYPSKKLFSKLEANRFEKEYGKYFDLLPILKDWLSYLKDVAEGKVMQESEVITAPELKSTVDKYVLLHELGIIDLLNKNPNYQNLSDTKKAMMLGLILGTDKIEMLRTCIIYAGNSNKGKLHSKNPLKPNNITNVRGLLLSQIGIDTTDKV